MSIPSFKVLLKSWNRLCEVAWRRSREKVDREWVAALHCAASAAKEGKSQETLEVYRARHFKNITGCAAAPSNVGEPEATLTSSTNFQTPYRFCENHNKRTQTRRPQIVLWEDASYHSPGSGDEETELTHTSLICLRHFYFEINSLSLAFTQTMPPRAFPLTLPAKAAHLPLLRKSQAQSFGGALISRCRPTSCSCF